MPAPARPPRAARRDAFDAVLSAALVAVLSAALLSAAPAVIAAPAPPPAAPIEGVVDTLWGVPVADPYRWMEHTKDARVQDWIHAQADYASAILDGLPGRDEMLARIQEFDAGRPWVVRRLTPLADGSLFYLKQKAGENLPKLFHRPAGGRATERLVLDPSTLTAADGGHVSISWYVPSEDGRRVAVGLAPSGSEQDILHVLDVASGAALPDTISRLEAGYTEPQWLPDGSGFFYSRLRDLPADAPETEGYRLSKSFFHALGRPVEADPVVFGFGVAPGVTMSEEDFPSIVLTPGSPFAIGKIKHGDANQLTLWSAPLADVLRGAAGGTAPAWKLVADVPDSVVAFAVTGESIDLVTSRHAPRFRVVRTGLAAPDFAGAAVVVPAGERVVEGIVSAQDALYVVFGRGGANALGRVPHGAAPRLAMLELPDDFPSGTIRASHPALPGIWASTAAWTRGGRSYRYDPKSGRFADAQLEPPGRYDAVPGYASIEVEVPSHDGVRVPLSIVYKVGTKKDGTNPTLLSGYGAYGINQNVGFDPKRLAWLEKGGVFAIAHVRGGGELGQEWHEGGQKATKPNTWKDFIACAEWLVKEGWTSPGKLAGQGGSAGGILIGRAITERPDLFAAALLDVGALDAVRAETTTNGVPNIQEFGTVTKEDEFHALLEMSALHHVQDGVKYPAVLLSHGINDPRVEPWESAKMCARLQAATASGKPVLFRVDYKAGHGIGSTRKQQQRSLADRWSFLRWQMDAPRPLP